MLANTEKSYGSVAKFFHWLVALGILFLIGLGLYMHNLPNGSAEQIDHKIWFYSLHKTIGVLVFFTAVLRIFWASMQPKPAPLAGGKPHEHWLAELVHWMLYGLLIVMPLSGWLHNAFTRGFAPIWLNIPQGHSFFPENNHAAEFFSWLHFIAGIALVLSIGLHIAGALKHFVIDKDRTLQRMLPFSGTGPHETTAKPDHKNRSPFWAACTVFAFVLAASYFSYSQKFSAVKPQKNASSQAKQKSNWIVDYPSSTLTVTIDQSGTLTSGKFEIWTSSIHFDPDDLENASVTTTIAIASLQLGGVSDQAKSADFLNAEKFPTAKFVSTEFERVSEGQYIAHGKLILAGIEQSLDLPFILEIKGEEAVMSSSFSINRMDYDIGKAGFGDESTVKFAVNVDISLTAIRK